MNTKGVRYEKSACCHVPLPTSIFVAILVVVLTNLLLRKTSLGLYIQAVGINKDASRLVGIKANKIIFFTYAFCGFLAGIAGLIASSRIYSADANNIGLNMTKSMSLSPLPDRLTRMVPPLPTLWASLMAYATACEDSKAGMMPSIRDKP